MRRANYFLFIRKGLRLTRFLSDKALNNFEFLIDINGIASRFDIKAHKRLIIGFTQIEPPTIKGKAHTICFVDR